jgi:peptidoglycan hydrolase-like protein with peptidoglycan-binding domain
MGRWTLLAISFAIVACADREEERLSRETSEAAADVDTALADAGAADTSAVETGASSQPDPETALTASIDRDTAPRAAESRATDSRAARASGPTGAEAMGGVRSAAASVDLSPDRVRRLQSALNDAGCDAGEVDGVVGSRTRRAIDCGLKKHGLGRDDVAGLYRELGVE